jgi:hypothetical protein
MCPACNSYQHDTQHLFQCQNVPTTLSTIDLSRTSRPYWIPGNHTCRLHSYGARVSRCTPWWKEPQGGGEGGAELIAADKWTNPWRDRTCSKFGVVDYRTQRERVWLADFLTDWLTDWLPDWLTTIQEDGATRRRTDKRETEYHTDR